MIMTNADNRVLAEKFHDCFDVALAKTEAQKRKAFRIRYRVYCEEFKFLNESDYEDGLEKDEYDEFSPQCLITHKRSGIPAACVRLVPAFHKGKSIVLPYELLGSNVVDDEFSAEFGVKRDNLCEISRLAVDGAFRRRSGEAVTRFGEIDAMDIEHAEKRTFGLISVAAFLASAALGELNGYDTGVAMMEPFLPRLMERSGISFIKAGEEIDYHGARAPYFVSLDSVLETMNPDIKCFYQSIRQSLS